MRYLLLIAFPLLVHLAVLRGSAMLEWAALCALILAALLTPLSKGNLRAWLGLPLLGLIGAGLVQLDSHQYILVLPSLAIPGAIFAIFASSLRPLSTPLVTRYAALLHPDMPIELLGYTRKVTLIWAITSASILLTNLLLLGLGQREWWSAFANGYSYALLGAVFAMEYAFRRWYFRHMQQPSFSDYMRVLRQYRPSSLPDPK